ncbi:MAG: hypothetical protein ACYCXQ_01055 [Candidatus Humimicrobiaceae bacterium]
MKKILLVLLLLLVTCFIVLTGCQSAIAQDVDFSFLWDINILALGLGIIVFGAWQLAKKIWPVYFNPIDEDKKKQIAILITNVNGLIAIIFAILSVGFKLAPDIPSGIGVMMIVFANGSLYDLLKSWNAVK